MFTDFEEFLGGYAFFYMRHMDACSAQGMKATKLDLIVELAANKRYLEY